MEKLDLTKILKNCPKGWKLWSPIFGEVKFDQIVESINFVNLKYVNIKKDNVIWSFHSDATFPINEIKSDEILLYPSKYQRDWNKFTAPWYKKDKFDPSTLKPFDKVLVQISRDDIWSVDFFSYYNDEYKKCICTGLVHYFYCIPYNDETKDLVGTCNEAPDYYKWW